MANGNENEGGRPGPVVGDAWAGDGRRPARRNGKTRAGSEAAVAAPTESGATPPASRSRKAAASRVRTSAGEATPPPIADQPELEALLAGLRDLRAGQFSTRLEPGGSRLMMQIAEAFNDVADRKQRMVRDLTRLSTTVGREGEMSARLRWDDVGGDWTVQVEAVNSLVTGLVAPTIEVARVIKAVAEGDLSQKMGLEIDGKLVQGEFLRIGTTVNRMVDQLGAFASEVTRVAREVGTDGVLGGQASVPGVAG
ncbi:MAG TPA: HAMP domain-containing protein, partial [Gemmatimonadaceae bacterium]|nr:HAMP domain-containing protein [Gemmatimonadaceae bacterium]